MRRPSAALILALLLVVSVALNLFFGGLMAGKALHAPEPPPGQIPNLRSLMDRLPDDDKARLKSIMEANQLQYRQEAHAFRESGQAVQAAARAEPFDPDALRRALAEHRAHWQAILQIRQEAFVDAMEKFSPETRHMLAQTLPGLREAPHKRPGGPGTEPPPPGEPPPHAPKPDAPK